MATPLIPARATSILTPALFQQLAGKDGRLSAKEIGRSGAPPPPKGYSYTYNFSNPSNPLGLKREGNATLGKLGDIAKVAVPIVLAATGVGAPAAAAIMAATYAADKKADGGSWGDAAKAGALGGAGGYISAGGITSTGGKVAANAALGGASGAMDGGGIKGAVLGAAAAGGGGGGNAMAGGTGWKSALSSLAKDPQTYAALAQIAGNAGAGQSQERQSQNSFTQGRTNAGNQQFGVQQGARANLSQLQEQAIMSRAKLKVSSPSERLRQAVLGSLVQNTRGAKITPPAGVNMAQMSGGLTPDSLSAAVRSGGGEMERQALLALLTGSDVPADTNYIERGAVQAPTIGDYKEPGGFESALSGVGVGGSVLGTIGEIARINKERQGQRQRPGMPAPLTEYGD